MCGRYSQAVEPSELPFLFGQDGLAVDKVENINQANPRYNIGPAQNAPVYYFTTVTNDPNPAHVIQYMKWGVIPFWEANKNKSNSGSYNTFNAKLESIKEGHRLWKTLRGKTRCVVPIQGYYEWNTLENKTKIPYYISRKDGKFMYLAGLYSIIHKTTSDPETGEKKTERIGSFTIITGPAPNQLKWLHPRMPIVLEPGTNEFNNWLDPNIHHWSEALENCLKPYELNTLNCHRVAKDVGNVRNEGKYLTEEFKEEPEKVKDEDGIKKWFTSPKKEKTLIKTESDTEDAIENFTPLSSPTKHSSSPKVDHSSLSYSPRKRTSQSVLKSKKPVKGQMSIDQFLSSKKR